MQDSMGSRSTLASPLSWYGSGTLGALQHHDAIPVRAWTSFVVQNPKISYHVVGFVADLVITVKLWPSC